MTTEGPVWGSGAGLDSYALAGSERVYRLLLPARSRRDASLAPWSRVATVYRYGDSVDGYTSWNQLTALPGDGAWAPSEEYDPADGQLPEQTAEALLTVFVALGAAEDDWVYVENANRGSVGAVLQTPFTHDPPRTETIVGGRARTGPVGDLVRIWVMEGFHGRAHPVSRVVGMASDSWADSVILSGSEALGPALARTSLEVFPVSRMHASPIGAG